MPSDSARLLIRRNPHACCASWLRPAVVICPIRFSLLPFSFEMAVCNPATRVECVRNVCCVDGLNLLTRYSHPLGKLRCDHNMPCGRCLLRKSGHVCVYTTTKSVPGSKRQPSATVRTPSLSHSQPLELEAPDIQTEQQSASDASSMPASSCSVQGFSTEDSTYLGHSSSSAVVQEINASLGYTDGPQARIKTSPPSRPSPEQW